MVAGRDARDFVLPRGNTIVIPPKATLNIGVEFKSRCAFLLDVSIFLRGDYYCNENKTSAFSKNDTPLQIPTAGRGVRGVRRSTSRRRHRLDARLQPDDDHRQHRVDADAEGRVAVLRDALHPARGLQPV